jgi:hypothetical protein
VKPFKFITGWHIRHIDPRDFRARRTNPQFADKPVQPGQGPPRQRLNPTIGQVPHPSRKLKVPGRP